jgi:hypothetical protein
LEKAMSEVTLRARLEGVDEVTDGFERMGNAAGNMGNKVASSSRQMETNYRSLMMTTAGLIGNSVQLGDIMDRMAKGQMDVGRGALMLSMNFLQLASQLSRLATAEAIATAASWAHTIAKKAEAIALGIVNALTPWGWAILAGAAVAAAGAIALAERIPSKQYGGIVERTGPYLLHAGEFVIPKGGNSIAINIYGADSPRATGDAVIDALRRSGVI